MVRVVIIQPSLAKYRVPVYKAIAERPEIDIKVVYAETPSIPNAVPDGFASIFGPLRFLGGGSDRLIWHGAQIRYASRDKCDVLILSWDVHYLSLFPALFRARANGIRTILWGHGASKRERPWRKMLRQLPARIVDALLFYSYQPAARYTEEHRFPKSKVFVAPNCLDQSGVRSARAHWLEDPSRLSKFKADNNINGNHNILFCSRLDPANRLDLLLRAVHEVKKVLPDVSVNIIGSGQIEAELKGLSFELSLQNNVRFIGAIYDESENAPWFLSSDVFCYPENLGLSLFHAFGYGLPVVASNRKEVHGPEFEALRHAENGWLYQHGDHHSLASALTGLLTDPELRQRLAYDALQTVENEYSLNCMVDGFISAIMGNPKKLHE